MQNMSAVKTSILCAVCIALCVVLPQAFHAIPNAGPIYCPMHIPILLCGLLCGWSYGLLCGVAGPVLSCLITGMPPATLLPVMTIECAAYGTVSGLLIRLVRTKKIYVDLYISLIAAMLCGRLAAGLATALIFAEGSYTVAAWATGYFVTKLPGIIIQIVLLPSIVFALIRAGLISEPYPKDLAVNKEDVIDFFNNMAPHWDTDMVRNEGIINLILDNAGVTQGKDVLDIACGTGVLFPDYLKRKAASVTGIDISSAMVEIAKMKFRENRVDILCGDAEEQDFDRNFDSIVIYNSFPHFSNPERMLRKLAEALRPSGTLTVAHGMSREAVNRHHAALAEKVSMELMSVERLAKLFGAFLSVTVKISDERMYQVAGTKA